MFGTCKRKQCQINQPLNMYKTTVIFLQFQFHFRIMVNKLHGLFSQDINCLHEKSVLVMGDIIKNMIIS